MAAESGSQHSRGHHDAASNGGSLHSTNKAKVVLHEAYFLPLRNQSNIYGLLHLYINGANTLVVTTLRGEVYNLEFHDPLKQRPPSFKSITFSYIPVGVEVVSIDAITKVPNGIIIGIALIKTETDTEPNKAFLNLYGIHSDSQSTFQWENIADDWQPLNLKYTPFQIANTKILAGDHWEPVFLVSGDDLKIHLYRESCLSSAYENQLNYENQFSFQEESCEQFFPEFQDLPSSVTYMDIKLIGTHRLTALGCQAGYLRCSLVDLTSNVLVKTFNSSAMDGPITSVKLFTAKITCRSGKDELSDYHLLVGSAVELGVVFLNVLECGFGNSLVLPSSHIHDSVLCSTVADLDWDGRKELVLGTYGKQILVYRVDEEDGSAELVWRRSFSHPIHGLWYGDLTRDGLSELAVLSMGGIHILQHDMKQVSELCIKRSVDMLNLEEQR